MRFFNSTILQSVAVACALFVGQTASAQYYSWANSVGSTAASTAELAQTLARDAAGNVIIGGQFRGAADFDPSANVATLTPNSLQDGFLAKYNAAGAYQWAFNLGDTLCTINNITTDAANNIYAIGIFRRTVDFDPSAATVTLSSTGANTYDIFVAKYNAAGAFQWVFNLGGTSDDTGGDIALDSNGDLLITGFYQGTIDADPSTTASAVLTNSGSYDAFVGKYSASTGAYISSWRWGGAGSDRAFSMAVDGANNVLVSGRFTGTIDLDPSAATVSVTTAGTEDGFLAKYSSAGVFLWHGTFGSTAASEECLKVAVDASNNVYAVGTFSNTVDFDPSAGTANLTAVGGFDGYVVKFTATGIYQWAFALGSTGADNVQSIAIDNNNLLVTGAFTATTDFDPSTTNAANLVSAGVGDIYIAKYTLAGAYVNALTMGGTGADLGRDIVAYNGDVLIAGSFSTTADFDPSATNVANLVSMGSTDIFVAKYVSCINPDVPTVTASAASICEGSSSVLSVGSANLGNATAWNWYTSSCGGTLVGTGATITVNPTVSTTYYVRGEGGCVAAASCGSYALAVTPNPVAVTTPTNVNCYGDATGRIQILVTNGTAPYTYAWSDGAVGSPRMGITAGVYYVTVTDASGCTVTVSETITQPAAALTSSISANNINCTATTGSATVTAAGGTGSLMVEWSNGETTYTATGLAAGTYSATVTDANACVSTSTTTIVSTPSTLSVSANVSSNYNGANISCANANDGEATAVAGSGATPYNYMWSNGQNTAVATALGAGVFAVTATDANGCVANASVTVVAPSAVTATVASTTDATCATCTDGSIALSAAGGTGSHTYLWSNGQTTSTATGLAAGSYTFTVSDLNGCVATGSASISFQVAVNKTLANSINIYPNPTTQFVNVAGLVEGTRLALVNALGQIIWSVETNNTTIQLDLSNIAPSVYYLQISTPQGVVTKPVTRQ